MATLFTSYNDAHMLIWPTNLDFDVHKLWWSYYCLVSQLDGQLHKCRLGLFPAAVRFTLGGDQAGTDRSYIWGWLRNVSTMSLKFLDRLRFSKQMSRGRIRKIHHEFNRIKHMQPNSPPHYSASNSGNLVSPCRDGGAFTEASSDHTIVGNFSGRRGVVNQSLCYCSTGQLFNTPSNHRLFTRRTPCP